MKSPEARTVALCLAGVLARSTLRVWPTIERRALRPMRSAGLHVDIYVFQLVASVIDGVTLSKANISAMVPYTVLESESQQNADNHVDANCGRGFVGSCSMFNHRFAHAQARVHPPDTRTAVDAARQVCRYAWVAVRQPHSTQLLPPNVQRVAYRALAATAEILWCCFCVR